MTELSGTLEGVGLPAIVRFLAGLGKTGCLHITHDDWRGEVFFNAGQVTSASLGSRHGLPALDAMVQVMAGGSFSFESDARATDGEGAISLSRDALFDHLEEVVARSANDAPTLPPLDAVPELVGQNDSSKGEEPLPLDRATLQTLLAVDGQKTVREIIAQRGSFDTLWQLGNLADVGLIQLRTDVANVGSVSSVQLETAEAKTACPKLGFEDDPSSSFGRPTRLHRCFAAGAPLPLSLDQQRELCLSEQFGTCPRLTMANAARPEPFTRSGPVAARPEHDTDDPRIVRLPFANSARGHGAVADRQAVGSPEPTRFRPSNTPTREPSAARPTPLRSRAERAGGPAPASAVAEPPAAATPEQRDTKSLRSALVDEPAERRLIGVPIAVLAGGSVILVVLAALAFLLGPHLGDLFADENLDPSALPNSSAVAAGAAVPQLTPSRATPSARATAAANATTTAAAPAATTTAAAPGTSASATSAAAAPPQPTLPPEPTAAAPAPAATAVFEEDFANSSRNWPSSNQGTALLATGSYRLMSKTGQFVAIGAPITNMLSDVIVSATFHKLSGPSGGGYGIILRDQASVPQNGTSQDGRYYVLEAGDKGDIGIWRRDGNTWADLVPWKHSDAVETGTATNELTARAIGSRLTLTVNGTQVASIADDQFTTGNAGVFAGGDGNQVAVDKFSIHTP
jgi:hypothetical protein